MIVVVVGLLVAILLVIVAALVWQEAVRRGGTVEMAYVVDDAVDVIFAGLAESSVLRRSDVRRIIEWEIFQLQGLAERSANGRRSTHNTAGLDVIAGGTEQTVAYIVDRIAETHGVTYAPEDVARVLALEARYLHDIGAVGAPVEFDNPEFDNPEGE